MGVHHGWPKAPGWAGHRPDEGTLSPMQMTPTEAAFASSAFGVVCSYLLALAGHIENESFEPTASGLKLN
jgi:hypothetical protein